MKTSRRKNVGVIVSAAFLLASCGTAVAKSQNGTGGSMTGVTTSSTSTTTSAPAVTTPTAPEHTDAGTFNYVLTGGGTLTEQFTVGTPITQGAPSDAQSAATMCTDSLDPQVDDNSVFIPVVLKVTYSGTVPQSFSIADDSVEALDSTDAHPVLALEIDGTWQCAASASQSSSGDTFSGGESQTYSGWIIGPGVISNNSPTFVPSSHPDWVFLGLLSSGNGVQDLFGDATSVSVSGVNAMQCTYSDFTLHAVSVLGFTSPFAVGGASCATA